MSGTYLDKIAFFTGNNDGFFIEDDSLENLLWFIEFILFSFILET